MSGDSSYRRQVVGTYQTCMQRAESTGFIGWSGRIVQAKAGSGGRLRGAGSGRAAWRAEVSRPLLGTQAALAQVRSRQLQVPRFQGSEGQFGRRKGDIPPGHGEFPAAQWAFRVIERLPVKPRRPRLIEGRLQRPEMLPLMNPLPIEVCGYQQDADRSTRSQPEREI